MIPKAHRDILAAYDDQDTLGVSRGFPFTFAGDFLRGPLYTWEFVLGLRRAGTETTIGRGVQYPCVRTMTAVIDPTSRQVDDGVHPAIGQAKN
jgi:hypothetical protein